MHARTTRTSAALIGGGVLTALVLAGCGSSSPSGATGRAASPSAGASLGPAAAGPHNRQDVTFATQMLPHHEQAVEMARMALERDTDARVLDLARAVKAAQAPEIAALSGWLAGWGAAVPGAGGHGHAMSSAGDHADGMMSDDDMAELDDAAGTTFARLWLLGMVRHHEGAVAMARTELASGQNAQAKALAGSIVASQSREIARMKGLLAALTG